MNNTGKKVIKSIFFIYVYLYILKQLKYHTKLNINRKNYLFKNAIKKNPV